VTVLSIDTQTVVSGIIEYTTVTVTVVMPTPPPGMVATTIIDTFQTADQLSPRGDRFGCAVCPGDASCDVRLSIPNILSMLTIRLTLDL
jgi:hypothetical protein